MSARDPFTLGLFARGAEPGCEQLAEGAVLLRGFALSRAEAARSALGDVVSQAPFRRMQTPGGRSMSVATTNCGVLGWVSDERGYRYSPVDPQSGHPWPPMPAALAELGREAAARAGFAGFAPDVCLINRYAPGARMGLHQDRDERDLSAPIVSISLGLPAVFLLGGLTRAGRPARVGVVHGDVVVFGGASRLRYHGVAPVAEGEHPWAGAVRINLTFRQAG